MSGEFGETQTIIKNEINDDGFDFDEGGPSAMSLDISSSNNINEILDCVVCGDRATG